VLGITGLPTAVVVLSVLHAVCALPVLTADTTISQAQVFAASDAHYLPNNASQGLLSLNLVSSCVSLWCVCIFRHR
jgi:hypothetical protein